MTTIKRRKTSPRKARDDSRDGSKTESLWLQYRRSRAAKTRNLLIERYRGFVEGMAASMASRLPRSVDVQDLTHAGVWGLMRAIENFQSERGNQFLAFMRLHVRGAMLDELRNMDHLPRLVRHRKRERDAAEARLRQRLSREPSDEELAAELGIAPNLLNLRFAPPASTGAVSLRGDRGSAGANGPTALDDLVDEDLESPFEALSRRDLLDKIKATLQPVEWRVLELHYLRGLSGKEVARRLRLSASRVCQIHGRVLSKLKTRLTANP
ncbi:MAG: sigma-70 family RNA polymerase sigma factor [Planctomycetota bacterium]